MRAKWLENFAYLALGAALSYLFWRPRPAAGPSAKPSTLAGPGPADVKQIAGEVKDLREQIQWQYQGMLSQQEQTYAQVQALLSLYYQLSFTAPLPPMRQADISPDFANLILTFVRERQPLKVLVLGGEVGGLIAAYCLSDQGYGQAVIVADDLNEYERLCSHLSLHQLEAYTEAVHAPLTGFKLKGEDWVWYKPDFLDSLSQIDFVIVTGPDQNKQPIQMIRYPALPLMFERLSHNAMILVDNTKGGEEQRMIERWLADYPALAVIGDFETEKGAILLQKLI
jgi:hypothetical protein